MVNELKLRVKEGLGSIPPKEKKINITITNKLTFIVKKN